MKKYNCILTITTKFGEVSNIQTNFNSDASEFENLMWLKDDIFKVQNYPKELGFSVLFWFCEEVK